MTDKAAAVQAHYDPFQFYEEPYETFRALRDIAPAYHNPKLDLWVLSRFEDVHSAARNRVTFSSAEGVALDDESEFYSPGGFLDYDPPDHDRLRDVMAAYFTPRTIAQLEVAVRGKAQALLDRHLSSDSFDFAREIARVLPSSVVCTLLGFPEEDHPTLLTWFELMTSKTAGTGDAPRQAWDANRQMRNYVEATAAARVRRPADDLITVLAKAREQGEIRPDELAGMSILVFYAGIMTTAAFLENSVANLHLNEGERHRLVEDPSLIPVAVEELLRFDSPVQSVSRVTTESVEIHGAVIESGKRILLLYGSANRDDRRWERADRLDITRERKQHLAFGVGLHHCLGSSLARLEGRVLLEELLQRAPQYEVMSGERLFAPHERGFISLIIDPNCERPATAMRRDALGDADQS